MESTATPKVWTSVNAANAIDLPATWQEHTAPQQLQYVPEDIRPPAKLLDILMWSLERPNTWSPTPPESSSLSPRQLEQASQIQVESFAAVPDLPKSGFNNAASKVPYEDPSRTSVIEHATASKGDLVTAVLNKISALKAKKSVERPVSSARPPVPVMEECTSCFEDTPIGKLVRLSCTHYYCKPCLASLVMAAIQHEASYPPKCCLTEIPSATVLIPLDLQQRNLYKIKAAEYSVPASKRLYCPNTACAKWIQPSKLRANPQCSSCGTKVCSQCKGLKHARAADCPQDQDMAAVLNTAHANGWRRCIRCRTMVEKATGCRHITCNCGAQFCYVCGAKWRTCSCTEADEAQRQAVLQQQRELAYQEDAEIRRAMTIIAGIEAREAAELARRRQEEGKAIMSTPEDSQRQEEEILARLEEERAQEQERARQEAEALERELREVLQLSIRLEAEALEQSLLAITHSQYTRLDDAQGRQEQAAISAFRSSLQEQETKTENSRQKMMSCYHKKFGGIGRIYEQRKQAMLAGQEQQEDETFMQIQLFLRGKPNKESREQRMLAELRQHHATERSKLEEDLSRETKDAQDRGERAAEVIRRASEAQVAKLQARHESDMATLARNVRISRHWFCVVSTRRAAMVEMHNRLLDDEVRSGVEPVGLTREMASTILPLPALTVPSVNDEIRPSTSSHPDAAADADSLGASFKPSGQHLRSSSGSSGTSSDCTFVSANTSSCSDRNSKSTPLSSPHSIQSLRPPTPAAVYVPSNGPAFVASKKGESSKAIVPHVDTDLIPTLSETPIRPQSACPPPRPLPTDSTEPSISALASSGAALATPATSAAPQAWSFYNTIPMSNNAKGKGHDRKAESKGKQREGEDARSVTSKESKKSSRWPFWQRKELTPEQIRERLANLKIGDAV